MEGLKKAFKVHYKTKDRCLIELEEIARNLLKQKMSDNSMIKLIM